MVLTTRDVIDAWGFWANRLGTSELYYESDFESAAASIDPVILKELGKFYDEARRDGHRARINEWLAKEGGKVPMSIEEKSIRNLGRFFGHLAYRDYKPFTAQALTNFDVEPIPDWSKLPPSLRFLGAPAENCARKFHYVFSEDGREYIQRSATPEEVKSLTETAEQIRANGLNTVKEWYSKLGVAEHIEASMVFSLVGVLDALNLPYFRRS